MAEPGPDPDARGPRWWMLLALPGVLGPLGIFAFIFHAERAHDPDRCPYEQVDWRPVTGTNAHIREDRRRCLPDVEERQFTLVRGEREQVLGRRRFAPALFEAPEYGWDAGVSDAGEVHMVVQNPGRPVQSFREGTEEDERAAK